MASNSSFFEAFSSQGLWVIRTGRNFYATALNSLRGNKSNRAEFSCIVGFVSGAGDLERAGIGSERRGE